MMLLRTISALWNGFLAVFELCDPETLRDSRCAVRGDGE